MFALIMMTVHLSVKGSEQVVRLQANGWSLNKLARKYEMDPKSLKKRLTAGFDPGESGVQ